MSRARNLAGFGSAITSVENPVNIRVGYITAIAYYGDGSELTGTPGGLGTALAENLSSPLNKIYYTNANLSIASTITVDPPESASAAYTQYTDIVMQGDADLIVGDGDTFIPDILGIGTDVDMPGILAGGNSKVRADNYTNKKGTGAAYAPYGLAVRAGTAVSVGNGTAGTPGIVGVDTTTGLFFPSDGGFGISISGSERLTVASNGNVGVGSEIPGEKFVVIGPVVCKGTLGVGQTSAGVLDYSGNDLRIRCYGPTAGSGAFAIRTGGGAGSTDTERLSITSGGQVQVSTGSTLQLGQVNPSSNIVYNVQNEMGSNASAIIKRYIIGDQLNAGEKSRFTFRGDDRAAAMITINAVGSWGSSNTANNHVAAQFMCRVFTNSSGTSSDSSTVTTPFAYTYSTSNYTFTNSGGEVYTIDIQNPTGDSGVTFSYEVIIQSTGVGGHYMTATSTVS